MAFQPPMYSQSMHYISGISGADELAKVQANALDHAQSLIQLIQSS